MTFAFNELVPTAPRVLPALGHPLTRKESNFVQIFNSASKERLEAVAESVGGFFHGNTQKEETLYCALAVLPEPYFLFAVEKIQWVCLVDKCMGTNFSFEDVKPKTSVIVLSERVFDLPLKGLFWVVCHELGHCFLGHKKGFSQLVLRKQEAEAEDLAFKIVEEVEKNG